MKYSIMILGFFVSAVLLNGVLTTEHFEWWMVFILVPCAIDFITTIFVIIKKVRRGEW